MGGVDLSDMLIELYRIDIRGKKWYMRLFYYFLDISVTPQRPNCSTPKRPKLAKPKPYNSVCYDGIQHWPEACFKCHVSLCLVKNRNCFKIFHTQ
ncbi:hypothetical protein QYM36_012217 [Artemia franciscana]|uniref:PiggyBac transposable element-derived protein domain-containing protein n=1 Tax=Artemia franciscana TaxID=6661 RepID=A0AA88HL64_ARTSF|nr:hypothetical protein QYM36_012217 [Artemia franciscana]